MKGPGPSKLRINRPDPYKRKTRKEKSRFLASLEITRTETALKSQKEGRAEARPYTEQYPA
jgi:hypothetical protein